MRWSTCYHAALATGALLGTSDAFAPHSARPSQSQIHVGGLGWDNENYMDALGKGGDALNQANADYFDKSRFGKPEDPDAQNSASSSSDLPKETIEKIKQQNENEEEGQQGGQLFQQMMQRAQQQNSQPSTQAPVYTPPPPPQQPAAATPDLSQLSVEEQARLFREMMRQQQQQSVAPPSMPYTPAPPKTMVGGVDDKGRKIGRNRDADAINNTSDLYFAQLKRDSTARNYARYAGDEEKANAVFNDPSVHEIELKVNPYLEEQKKKEREMIETSDDESLMPIVQMQQAELEEKLRPKTNKGPSYKERLQQIKGGVAPAAKAPVEAPPAVAPMVETPPPPAPAIGVSSAPAPVELPPTIAPTGPKSEDNMRKDIRQLMGLLLKHRGGPGFGMGRLEGEQAQQLETLATDISRILQEEALSAPAPVQAPPVAPAAVDTPASPVAQEKSKVGNVIACIEGAITMYKNSPVELQESVLITLRAALLSAVNTLNDLIVDQAPAVPSAAASEGTPAAKVENLINVIEGAIVMYKNSPPELQGSVLVALRAALLSSVNTLNGIIATNEQANVSSYDSTIKNAAETASPTASAPAAAPSAPAAAPAYRGDDANSKLLRDVYAKLQNAAGSGSMGLRDDLSADEVTDLANSIADMRAILVDELNSGISPSAAPPSNDTLTTVKSAPKKEAFQSSVSKYQQMLNKAKAQRAEQGE